MIKSDAEIELEKRLQKLHEQGGRLHIDWSDAASEMSNEEIAKEILNILDQGEAYISLPERTRMLMSIRDARDKLRTIMKMCTIDPAHFNPDCELQNFKLSLFGMIDMLLLDLGNWNYEIKNLGDRP